MKTALLAVVLLGLLWTGCARVRVEAPKDAIKVDISMRLDIYQHVAKDINDIEGIVSGTKPGAVNDHNSLLNSFVSNAYAEDGLSSEVEQAALRRKDRRPQLIAFQQNGAIGENKSGLLEIRDASKADSSAQSFVAAENSDRMIIYQSVAKKNGTSVEEVKKLYALRLQSDAPSGTPIEVLDESTGSYSWKLK